MYVDLQLGGDKSHSLSFSRSIQNKESRELFVALDVSEKECAQRDKVR